MAPVRSGGQRHPKDGGAAVEKTPRRQHCCYRSSRSGRVQPASEVVGGRPGRAVAATSAAPEPTYMISPAVWATATKQISSATKPGDVGRAQESEVGRGQHQVGGSEHRAATVPLKQRTFPSWVTITKTGLLHDQAQVTSSQI